MIEANMTKKQISDKRYKERHPDRVKASQRNWVARNQEYVKQLKHEWWIKNKVQYQEKRREKSKHFIRFKNKQVLLDVAPRTGVCSKCNAKGLTHMHHTAYDESDPLKHTVELCPKCHMTVTQAEKTHISINREVFDSLNGIKKNYEKIIGKYINWDEYLTVIIKREMSAEGD